MNTKRFKTWQLTLLITLLLMAVLTIAWFIFKRQAAAQTNPADNYITQAVSVGDVRRTVSASGTLKPVSLIDVGTQISGTIRALHVDFNDSVQAGQLLAEIDPALLDADLAQAQALQRSAQTNLDLMQTRLVRNKSLLDQGYVSRSEVDDAQAAVKSARATLDQQLAGVQKAANNRRYTQIRSPVSGTVVSREISVGQTVAASLQTPVLFKIAKDLREMQIETNVSEADVGYMRVGQKVSFTVDAFADKTFQGVVHQIRNNHVVQQNVVTYTVIVRTRNEDLSLRPGMTGYVTVVVGERNGILRIPNAALRYEPGSGTTNNKAKQAKPANQRTVWRLTLQKQPEAVEIVLGLTDSRYTELLSGSLKDTDQLIIGEKIMGGFSGPKIF
jgi:HlyD family secretion protein